MDFKPTKEIYKALTKKSVHINHACEIGVYLPTTSNIIDYIRDDKTEKITLVEPNPRIVKEIEKEFVGIDKINLIPIAIHEYDGMLTLFEAEASTFADGLPSSPALVNDQYAKTEVNKIETPCKRFSELDPGDIDLLSIDTEGCEWYALKTMESRPKVLSIETHGKFYTNPFINEIMEWVDRENYIPWYKTKSDTVFIRKGLFKLSFSDRLRLMLMNLRIALRRAKKVFYQKRKS